MHPAVATTPDAVGCPPFFVAALNGATRSCKVMKETMAKSKAPYGPLPAHLAEGFYHGKSLLTALHQAAFSGYNEMIVQLLEWGAPLDRMTHTGQTPLMLACTEGHGKAVELLLDGGADIDVRDNVDGRTAFHCACVGNHLNIAAYLVAKGCRGVCAKDCRKCRMHLAQARRRIKRHEENVRMEAQRKEDKRREEAAEAAEMDTFAEMSFEDALRQTEVEVETEMRRRRDERGGGGGGGRGGEKGGGNGDGDGGAGGAGGAGGVGEGTEGGGGEDDGFAISFLKGMDLEEEAPVAGGGEEKGEGAAKGGGGKKKKGAKGKKKKKGKGKGKR
jgi:hypothetical protein